MSRLDYKPRVIVESRRSVILSELAELSLAIRDYGVDDPNGFKSILTNGHFELRGNIALRLEPYLRFRNAPAIQRQSNIVVQGVTDHWGEPFRFLIQSLDTWTNAAALAGRRYEILGWSCGPNRKDERGHGDDIQDSLRQIFVPEAK
jgi:hypothetical protein